MGAGAVGCCGEVELGEEVVGFHGAVYVGGADGGVGPAGGGRGNVLGGARAGGGGGAGREGECHSGVGL